MKKKTTVTKAKLPHPVPIKRKPKLPKVQPHIEEELKLPEPKPAPTKIETPKAEPKYTMDDWQKEVAQHVPPGHPIPDWLLVKAPQ